MQSKSTEFELVNCLTILIEISNAGYTQGIRIIEEFLILITQSKNILRHNVEQSNKQHYHSGIPQHDSRTGENYQQSRGTTHAIHEPTLTANTCFQLRRRKNGSNHQNARRSREKGSHTWPTASTGSDKLDCQKAASTSKYCYQLRHKQYISTQASPHIANHTKCPTVNIV